MPWLRVLPNQETHRRRTMENNEAARTYRELAREVIDLG